MRGLPSQPHVARDPAPAIIDAPPAAAPDGWVLVPIYPTDEMIDAAEEDMRERRGCGMRVYAADVYATMLDALTGQSEAMQHGNSGMDTK